MAFLFYIGISATVPKAIFTDSLGLALAAVFLLQFPAILVSWLHLKGILITFLSSHPLGSSHFRGVTLPLPTQPRSIRGKFPPS